MPHLNPGGPIFVTESTSGVEGDDAPFVIGRKVRVPGQVLWQSPIRETGAGGDKRFFSEVAVAFARNETVVTDPVGTIWIGGEKILNVEIDRDQTSDKVQVNSTIRTETFHADDEGGFSTVNSCEDFPIQFMIEYIHDGSDVPNFFDGFRSGHNVVVTGAAEASNNGTFKVLKVTLDNPTANKSTLLVQLCSQNFHTSPNPTRTGDTGDGNFTPVPLTTQCVKDAPICQANVPEVAGNSIRFVQDLPEITPGVIKSITQYNGSNTQTADPTIEADLGTGKAQAHRGTTYVVMSIEQTKWRKSLPLVEGLVRENHTRTVGEAIAILVKRNGKLTDSDIDVTGLTDPFEGVALLGQVSAAEALTQIMRVHGINMAEEPVISGAGSFDVVLKFSKRSTPDTVVVADGDRGAHQFGRQPAMRLVESEEVDDSRLPTSVSVGFQDADNDYQPALRNFHGETTSIIDNPQEFETNEALSATDAEALVRIEFWNQFLSEKDKKATTLPPTYFDIAEGDQLSLNDAAGNPILLRVTEQDEGANGLIEVLGYVESVDLYSLTSFASLSGEGPSSIALPPELRLTVLDLPTMFKSKFPNDQPGTGDPETLISWLGVTALDLSAGGRTKQSWRGAKVFASVDPAAINWVESAEFLGQSVQGTVVGVLNGTNVSPTYWDNINTLKVTLDNSEDVLVSSNDRAVLAGEANWIVAGGEIIGYVTATKNGDDWDLTRLLRARRNTEIWMVEHHDGEQFLLLTDPNTKTLAPGDSEALQNIKYRAVYDDGSLADAADNQVPFQEVGRSRRPFQPTIINSRKLDNGDFIIRWRRRASFPFALLTGDVPPKPLGNPLRYYLRILDTTPTPDEIVRSILTYRDHEYLYTVAKQVSDFGSEQTTITLLVNQYVGPPRGFFTRVTIS